MEVKDRVRDVRERLFIDGQKVKDERIKEHI